MTEAYSLDPEISSVTDVQQPPELAVIAGPSETIRRMFMLLADGNSGMVDYRGAHERGGKPLHIHPQYLGRPALKAIE